MFAIRHLCLQQVLGQHNEGRGVVQQYRAKVSIVGAMRKSVDGRTWNGLTDQIDALKQDAATRTEAMELCCIRDDAILGSTFRPEVMRTTTDSELNVAIDNLLKKLEPSKWPHETRVLLLGRRVESLRRGRVFDKLHQVLVPIASNEFSLKQPVLGDLPKSSPEQRYLTYSKLWYKETIVMIIDEGEESFGLLKQLLAISSDMCEELDPCDLSDSMVDIVNDHKDCIGFMQAITDDLIGTSHKDMNQTTDY